MALPATELSELADFFARRFDPQLRPLDPGQPVDVAGWRDRLAEADGRGRLSLLLHRARRARPDDANLAEVVRLLSEPNRRADQLVGLLLLGAGSVAAALGLVSVGGLVAWGALQGMERAPVSDAALAAVGGGPVERPIPTLAVGATTAVERQVGPAATGRCARPEGGIVGYWYAGETPPRGDVAVLDRMVNVRTDYPSRANGWDAGTAIRCVLRPGDQVRMVRPAVHVDGDRYWVPLVSGALLPSAS